MYFLAKPVKLTWSISEKLCFFFLKLERMIICSLLEISPFPASYTVFLMQIHLRMGMWFEQVHVTADSPFIKKQTLPRSPAEGFLTNPEA